MAKCFPSEPPSDAPRSERVVHEALANGLPSDWVVLHGTRVFRPPQRGHSSHEGEIDFLVLHPRRGIVGLEVKGGTVGRDAGGWYSIDRGGTRHDVKDPGQQVQRAMHSLMDYLRRARRMSRIPWAWGVVVPDIRVSSDLSPGVRRDLIVDRDDLSSIRRALERVFESHTIPEVDPAPFMAKTLVEAIAPHFHLVPSLASRFEDELPLLVRFTEEQATCLDMLEEQRRVGIQGPAGTGKTLVAMEKARRSAEQGLRTIFLCFNEPLAKHLAERAEGFRVSTFHAFARDTAKAAGLPWKIPRGSDESSEFFSQEAPELLLRALEKLDEERFDAVIVDEGQDFKDVWWLAVENMVKGDESVLYVFYDPNQDIYDGGPVETLGLAPFRLLNNCRNTVEVAQFAYGYVELEAKTRPGAPKGIPVKELTYDSETTAAKAIRRLLHEFTADGKVDNNKIAVLTTGSADRGPIREGTKLGNLELVGLDSAPGARGIRIASLYRFKGLEADVVILFVADRAHELDRPRHMYVATSRARHALAVVRPTPSG